VEGLDFAIAVKISAGVGLDGVLGREAEVGRDNEGDCVMAEVSLVIAFTGEGVRGVVGTVTGAIDCFVGVC
jgi:hypothetical protein